jgi:hypothetical protein
MKLLIMLFFVFTLSCNLLTQNDSAYIPPGDSLLIENNDTSRIVDVTIDDPVPVKESVFEDPASNRIILAPTGRTIKQGKLQLASMVVIPFAALPIVHVGITDYINLGIGVSLPVGVFYIAPKIRFFNNDFLQISAGMLYAGASGSSGTGLGIAYVSSSIGTPDNAFHFGAGYNFTQDFFLKEPFFEAGGEVSLGKGSKVISENWFFSESKLSVLSAGLRFYGENLSFDALGVFTVGEDFQNFFYPLFTLAYTFDILQKNKK